MFGLFTHTKTHCNRAHRLFERMDARSEIGFIGTYPLNSVHILRVPSGPIVAHILYSLETIYRFLVSYDSQDYCTNILGLDRRLNSSLSR